ncbi:Ammonium transporter 1 member 3 [Holothuria leucospilota]|uniref:Ammonium transporter 1 member 3 n=1 Tax=Holothuria leucospilota TaxID=206669 RepID=A0A9Q1H1N2_HOLLE|nr:Ammonium transporter 1 member 3 [Holothuria leucospilota]
MPSTGVSTNISRLLREEQRGTIVGLDGVQWDDATWILTSAFIIFTMQSGFGLLESGSVSVKNEVNIMVKNAVDVLFGGISYWMLGFGFSAWVDGESNQFMGVSNFFLDADRNDESSGHIYALFFFKTSFATTATTIVSGAMAERTKLEAYIVFSFINTFVYCFPSHWMWSSNENWFRQLGAIDIAGASTVHLVGGVTGLVATIMLGPRTGRFDESGIVSKMGSPTNAVLGLFMLCYVTKRRKFDIVYIINGILGALVSITGLFRGGGFRLLGVQFAVVVVVSVWAAVISFLALKVIDLSIGIRIPLHEELLGADLVEHSVRGSFDKGTGEWYDATGNLVMIIDRSDEDSYKKSIQELRELLSNDCISHSAFGNRNSVCSYRRTLSFKERNRHGDVFRASSCNGKARRRSRTFSTELPELRIISSPQIDADISHQLNEMFEQNDPDVIMTSGEDSK